MKLESDKVEITRRENALELAEQAGTKAAFAERIERSPGQVGHFIGKNPTKNIGKSLARHIERCFDKPEGWLDVDHHSVSEVTAIYERLDPDQQKIALAQMRIFLGESEGE